MIEAKTNRTPEKKEKDRHQETGVIGLPLHNLHLWRFRKGSRDNPEKEPKTGHYEDSRGPVRPLGDLLRGPLPSCRHPWSLGLVQLQKGLCLARGEPLKSASFPFFPLPLGAAFPELCLQPPHFPPRALCFGARGPTNQKVCLLSFGCSEKPESAQNETGKWKRELKPAVQFLDLFFSCEQLNP